MYARKALLGFDLENAADAIRLQPARVPAREPRGEYTMAGDLRNVLDRERAREVDRRGFVSGVSPERSR